MALFSQCFALSGLTAPLLGGWLLDLQGHGAGLWLATSAGLLLGLPLAQRLRRRTLHTPADGPSPVG